MKAVLQTQTAVEELSWSPAEPEHLGLLLGVSSSARRCVGFQFTLSLTQHVILGGTA